MDLEKILISVCVITYKRPTQLQRLLESLVDQEISNEINYEIIVVDNDSNGTAERVVRGFDVGFLRPVIIRLG